jgi:hypothetical protein
MNEHGLLATGGSHGPEPGQAKATAEQHRSRSPPPTHSYPLRLRIPVSTARWPIACRGWDRAELANLCPAWR